MEKLPLLFGYEDLKHNFSEPKSYQSFLFRALKAGKISQIRKGLYGVNDPVSGQTMANKFQIASHLSPTAFLDGHLALEYDGLAEQSFVSEAEVASLTRFRDVVFQGVCYHAVVVKDLAGVEERMAEQGLRLASLERLLLDSVDHLSHGGGYEEITKAVGLMKGLDEERLLALLQMRGKEVLFLKTAFVLSTFYEGPISPCFYRECLKHRSAKKYYFGAKIGKGIYTKKWNLIVPPSSEDVPDELF